MIILATITFPLIETACKGLGKIFKPNFRYQKAGVTALNLTPQDWNQSSLRFPSASQDNPFKNTQKKKQDKNKIISQVLDQVNQRFGQETLLLASCGINPAWKMKAGFKSHSYTTNWYQLVRVLA